MQCFQAWCGGRSDYAKYFPTWGISDIANLPANLPLWYCCLIVFPTGGHIFAIVISIIYIADDGLAFPWSRQVHRKPVKNLDKLMRCRDRKCHIILPCDRKACHLFMCDTWVRRDGDDIKMQQQIKSRHLHNNPPHTQKHLIQIDTN